jgi:hypothetical protein
MLRTWQEVGVVCVLVLPENANQNHISEKALSAEGKTAGRK